MTTCGPLGFSFQRSVSRIFLQAFRSIPEPVDILAEPSTVLALAIGHWPASIGTILTPAVCTRRIKNRLLRAAMKALAQRWRDRCRAFDGVMRTFAPALRNEYLRLHGGTAETTYAHPHTSIPEDVDPEDTSSENEESASDQDSENQR